MHFHRLLFLAVFLSAVYVRAQYSASLPYRDVTVTSVNGAASFKGAPLAAEPGQPLLPVYTVTFLLPTNIDFSSVRVTLENPLEKELDETFDIMPSLPPTTRGEIVWPVGRRIVDGKDMDVYGRNAFFPAEFNGNVQFGAMRNYKLAKITVHPYRYNPVTRKLRVITAGTIVLNLPGSGTAVQQAPLMTTPESAVEEWLKSTVVNPQTLQVYGVQAKTGSAQSAALLAASGTYAIITTNAMVSGSTQFANLVALKRQKGFNVITVTEGTWGGGMGDAAANRIRTWLKNNYITQNIRYVLLIGNPDPTLGDVPMKMCWPQLGDASYPNAPTDFYYAELTGNWDINNDGYFGDYSTDFCVNGGPDVYAEVAVGRIPYYGTMATLDKIIQKIIRYENETAVEWRRFAMIPMEPSDANTPGFQIGEAIRTDFLVPKSIAGYRLYDAINAGAILEDVLALNPPAESPECSETRVLNSWKTNGFGLVTWFTHGWSGGASGVFSSQNAANLDDQHPSIVYQASCDNAYPEDNANLAYSLLSNGAVATIAATRVSWYNPGEVEYAGSPSNPGMLYSFVQNLVRDSMEAAPALNLIKANTAIYSSVWWMNWLDYNVYGCPDEALRLKPSAVAAPSGLTATAVSSTQINLSWADRSVNETGFHVERAPYNGSFTEIATVGPNVISYQNTGLSAGKQYQYRVRAYTSADNSLFSNLASTFTPGSTVNIAVGKPATASTVQSNNPIASGNDNNTTTRWCASSGSVPQWWSVDLGSQQAITGSEVMWEKAATGYKYQIQTSNDNATWTTRADLTNNTSSLQTQSQTWSASARYVRLYISALPSGAWASFSEFRVFQNGSPVNPPTGVTAQPTTSGQVQLSWNAVTAATSYNVWISSKNGGPYALAYSEITGNTYYFDLIPGNTYYFVVSAVSPDWESPYSAQISAIPQLVTPINLTATTQSSTDIQLYWWYSAAQPQVDGVTFQIEYATTGAFTLFNTYYANVGDNYFYPSGLTPGTTYQFRVRANKGTLFSAYTNIATARTNDAVIPPAAPTSLAASQVSATSVTLSWTDNSSNESGFIIEKSVSSSANFFQLAYLGQNATGYQDVSVAAGMTYYYRVMAYNADGNSGYTNILSVTTPTADPCFGVQGGGSGMKGTTFGLIPPYAAGSEYCKATDGDVNTFYDYSQANGGYAGLDLGSAKAITKIRYYPRSTFASRMTGGKFQGSNTSNSSGFVDLFTISGTPAVQWNEVTISNSTAYRWVRYLSPTSGYDNIAEMEFYTTTNNPPTVTTAAKATPSPATGTTTALSVLGADNGGEPGLTYTWATTGTPPAAVTFSVNGTNAAKNSTATFTKAGSYTLQATIKDAGNLTVTSSVSVTVNQTITSIVVSPASATVNTSATQQFTGTARDQFAVNMATQPTFTWTVSGGGTISSSGLFTAGTTAGGPYTVTASSGGKSGIASVTVAAQSIKVEAENATLAGTAAKNTNHTGYSGTGFVDGYYNSTTAKVTFTVNVATEGSYKVTLRYSAGNGTSTNTGLYVNSTTKLKNISCTGTTNWDTWGNQLETVTLNAGNNTIAYKAETSSGSSINPDYITVSK